MSFVDEWNLSYPIPNSIYSENTLSVRGRTVGQGGAGQYELKGSGSLANGDTLTAVDIIGHAIILEVVVPSTGQVVSLGTRYPVAKTGGKGSSASIPRLASRAPSPLFPDIASSDLPGPADPALRVSDSHIHPYMY